MIIKTKKDDRLELESRITKYLVKKKAQNILELLFRYIILVCIGFIILTPIYSKFKEAITAQQMLGLKNTVWISPAVSMQSFYEAFLIMDYPKELLCSIGNSLLLAFLQTFSAALAAYTFARLKFKGSDMLFGLVILTIIVPAQSLTFAQYYCFRNFDILGIFKLITGEHISLLNKTIPLYILAATGVGVKGGLYIYILRQSYRQLPVSIEEAAYVDGAGFLKTFFHIVIPGVSATLTTVAVLSFVWNYADTYFMSLLGGANAAKYHLALRLSNVQTNMRWSIGDLAKKLPPKYIFNAESPLIQNGVLCACSILVIAPLLILYLFVQKRFVQGVERSGLGGD